MNKEILTITKMMFFNIWTEILIRKFRNQFSFSNRINSLIIDCLYIIIPMCPLWFIFGILSITIDFDENTIDKVNEVFVFIPLTIIYFFFLNKDLINGRSIAKRVYGFKVIDIETEDSPGFIKCLIRNITIFFFIVELPFLFFSPNRRLGDYLAGTMTIEIYKIPSESILNEIESYDGKIISIQHIFMTLILILIGYSLSIFVSKIIFKTLFWV